MRFEGSTRTVSESQSQFRRRVNPCVKIIGFSAVDIPISLSDSGGDAIGINACSGIIKISISDDNNY